MRRPPGPAPTCLCFAPRGAVGFDGLGLDGMPSAISFGVGQELRHRSRSAMVGRDGRSCARASRSEKRGRFAPVFYCNPIKADQRFENWNERRAFALPYFLRSTTRESRVRKPPCLSTPRNSGSKWVRALERPWRTAPAWPERPPPDTRQITSYWPLLLATASGCWII